jgi:hypothetical protein
MRSYITLATIRAEREANEQGTLPGAKEQWTMQDWAKLQEARQDRRDRRDRRTQPGDVIDGMKVTAVLRCY